MKIADTMNRVESWVKSNFTLFCVAFAGGFVVHYPTFSEGLTSPDGYYIWQEYIAGSWELMLGRWALQYVDKWLLQALSSPALTSFLTIFLFSITAILALEILKIKNTAMRIMASLCIVCSPWVLNHIVNPYTADGYSMGVLFAVLAVCCCIKIKKKILGIVLGAFCLSIALGCYQANLGITAGLCLTCLILECLDEGNNTFLKIKDKLMSFFPMGVLGIGIYFIVLRAFLNAAGLELVDYKGASSIGIVNLLSHLGTSVRMAYRDFYHFFFASDIFVNAYEIKTVYCLTLCCAAVFLLYLLIRKRNAANMVACIVLTGLLPVACNILNIAAPETSINTLTSGGLNFVCLYAAAIFDLFLRQHEASKICWTGVQIVSILLLFCTVWNYALQNSADAAVQRARRNASYSLVNRVYAKLEADDRFSVNSPVLLSGVPQYGNYPLRIGLWDKANEKNDVVWADHYWQAFLQQYLGVSSPFPSPEQYNAIKESSEFADMPIYPDNGSIAYFDGVFVVKLS